MNIYEQYLSLLEEKKDLTKRIEEAQVKIYEKNLEKYNSKEEGSVSVEEDGFKITVTKKINYRIDQELADVVGIAFTKKYSLDKKKYNSLTQEERIRVDECLTTSVGKPTFKVELL